MSVPCEETNNEVLNEGVAIFAFESEEDGEMSVVEGEKLTILEFEGDWLNCRKENGETGVVPTTHVVINNDPFIAFDNEQVDIAKVESPPAEIASPVSYEELEGRAIKIKKGHRRVFSTSSKKKTKDRDRASIDSGSGRLVSSDSRVSISSVSSVHSSTMPTPAVVSVQPPVLSPQQSSNIIPGAAPINEKEAKRLAIQKEIDTDQKTLDGITKLLFAYQNSPAFGDQDSGRSLKLQKLTLKLRHTRFTRELEKLDNPEEEKDGSPPEIAMPTKKTREQQRAHVLNELIETERIYFSDLTLLITGYMDLLIEAGTPELEMEAVFCNVRTLHEAAESTLRDLEALSLLPPEKQDIGNCFLKNKELFEKEYAKYCKNQNDCNAVLEEWQSSDGEAAARNFLKECHLAIKDQTNAWDVGALLIKPVQRILKYPLLLLDLSKNSSPDTDEEINDRLMEAITVMQAVAGAINEEKRRKELVSKMVSSANSNETGYVKNFIKKAGNQASKIKGRKGGPHGKTSDEHFDELEIKMKTLERLANEYLRNLLIYVDQLKDSATSALNFAGCYRNLFHSYDSSEESDLFLIIHEIQEKAASKYKSMLEYRVVDPLKVYLEMYQTPNALISKRHDLAKHYEDVSQKASKLPQGETLVLQAESDYLALNNQLLEDIPKFIRLSEQVIHNLTSSYARSHREYLWASWNQCVEALEFEMIKNDENILEGFLSKMGVLWYKMLKSEVINKRKADNFHEKFFTLLEQHR